MGDGASKVFLMVYLVVPLTVRDIPLEVWAGKFLCLMGVSTALLGAIVRFFVGVWSGVMGRWWFCLGATKTGFFCAS